MSDEATIASHVTTIHHNPALQAWIGCYGADAHYNTYQRHDWPDDAYAVRREVVTRYAFAIPAPEALDVIASAGPVVEIGAGTGYWAELLRHRGCDVVAYDLMADAFNGWFPHGLVGQVGQGGIEMAAKHADRTLLLVWPPMDSMAYDAAIAYAAAGGQRLVYIGEGPCGCTADEQFFALLDQCDKDWDDDHDCSTHDAPVWREVAEIDLPQWDGIHDRMRVFERGEATT